MEEVERPWVLARALCKNCIGPIEQVKTAYGLKWVHVHTRVAQCSAPPVAEPMEDTVHECT